ncbi:hypothetical protein D3C81_1529290 [compost metagenome]
MSTESQRYLKRKADIIYMYCKQGGMTLDMKGKPYHYRYAAPLYSWRWIPSHIFMELFANEQRHYCVVDLRWDTNEMLVSRRNVQWIPKFLVSMGNKRRRLLYSFLNYLTDKNVIIPDYSIKPSWKWLIEARKRARTNKKANR